MKKINISKLVILAAMLVFAVLVGIKLINRPENPPFDSGQTMKDPGAGPSEQEQKVLEAYYIKCPFEKVSALYTGNDFDITSSKCSENNLFKDTVKNGEEVKVDILTQDFEQGKQIFRDWLKSKGLVESPTLRITYTFKPQ